MRSLKARLLAGLLALVTVGLAASGGVTYAVLRAFLLSRVNQEIVAAARPLSHAVPAMEHLPAPLDVSLVRDLTAPGTFLQINNYIDGVVFTLPIGPPGQTLPPPRVPARPASPQPLVTLPGSSPRPLVTVDVTATSGSLHYRLASYVLPGDAGILVLAVPLNQVDFTLRQLLLVEVLAGAAVLAAVTLAGLTIVRLGLRPLADIESTAGAIAAGDLSRRIEGPDPRTEVGRLAIALNAMLTQIESAFSMRETSERRLRRFVADASHELRTPLTSIRGYAELFRRGAATRTEDLDKAMSRIEAESKRMGKLVDDLLLLARLDQGRPLSRQPVDLCRVATDVADDARVVSPSHPVTARCAGPVIVEGDDDRLRQVASNLVTNACQHTPPGTAVEVIVSTRPAPAGPAPAPAGPAPARPASAGRVALLEVIDHGPGLDAEAREHVFDRFYRADTSRSRDHGGSGLGLSIVAAVAASHGGRAYVDPAPEGGCRFVVELPMPSP
ncbi:MAG: sensor histidine kinase [Acidimicrobiales bacterium]